MLAQGEIDLAELTKALKVTWHAQNESVRKRHGEAERQRERVAALAGLTERAAVAAEAAEAGTRAVLESEAAPPNVAARCHVAIKKKQIKPSDLFASMTSWE